MIRPTNRVGQQPNLWLLFVLSLRKCFKLRYLLFLLILLILLTYLRLIIYAPSDQTIPNQSKTIIIIPNEINLRNQPCHSYQTEPLVNYIPSNDSNDSRPKPTIERLHKLFQILISYEKRFEKVFNYLNIFRFTDLNNTLRSYENHTGDFDHIYCSFQHYLPVSNHGQIEIKEDLIIYLKKLSNYLSDGFRNEHLTWKETSKNPIQKPVIVLAANTYFYETLQASMRTVNNHLKNYTVAIYDLGFNPTQLMLIKANCQHCLIIPFPFTAIESVAAHVRSLGTFAWKPILIQDAVRRFGSIIYGDTSIRYHTSNFDRLLIDNLIRGFSCRELPGHYLPCFTLSGTFRWFNEKSSAFDDVYIAEAGFLAVTDNFLSRLILKTWVTCALDLNCIAPINSRTQCKRTAGFSSTHRYDQSAMAAVLSFYFFPSPRQNGKSDPAPYDMYTSIQAKIAEVRRFEGEKNYFTNRQQNSSVPTVTIQ